MQTIRYDIINIQMSQNGEKQSTVTTTNLGNGHFFTAGGWNLDWLLSNEFLSLYECIPQPKNTGFGILDQRLV